MKVFKTESDDDLIETMTRSLEQEAGKKIFTLRILDRVEEGLETVVVFEDKSVMMALISVETFNGNIACRMRGTFI